MAKAKVVSPPELDIPDDVLTALRREDAPRSLADVSRELLPLSDQLRATIADIALIPVERATTVQRTELVELRERLYRAMADLSTWVDAIDIGFRRAALATGASEFVLTDGVVKVEAPRGEWVVNVPALHAELKEFVAHGVISQEELDSIFTTVVTEKANGSRLNYFASKRGEELAEAINRSRTWKAGDPAAAKVRIQRIVPSQKEDPTMPELVQRAMDGNR